jgi:hypothetical protein
MAQKVITIAPGMSRQCSSKGLTQVIDPDNGFIVTLKLCPYNTTPVSRWQYDDTSGSVLGKKQLTYVSALPADSVFVTVDML